MLGIRGTDPGLLLFFAPELGWSSPGLGSFRPEGGETGVRGSLGRAGSPLLCLNLPSLPLGPRGSSFGDGTTGMGGVGSGVG